MAGMDAQYWMVLLTTMDRVEARSQKLQQRAAAPVSLYGRSVGQHMDKTDSVAGAEHGNPDSKKEIGDY